MSYAGFCEHCKEPYYEGKQEKHRDCAPPSPASPAVGADEEAEAYFKAVFPLSDGTAATDFERRAFRAGFSRGGEVEREKLEAECKMLRECIVSRDAEIASWKNTHRLDVAERQRLQAGLAEVREKVAAHVKKWPAFLETEHGLAQALAKLDTLLELAKAARSPGDAEKGE